MQWTELAKVAVVLTQFHARSRKMSYNYTFSSVLSWTGSTPTASTLTAQRLLSLLARLSLMCLQQQECDPYHLPSTLGFAQLDKHIRRLQSGSPLSPASVRGVCGIPLSLVGRFHQNTVSSVSSAPFSLQLRCYGIIYLQSSWIPLPRASILPSNPPTPCCFALLHTHQLFLFELWCSVGPHPHPVLWVFNPGSQRPMFATLLPWKMT